MGLFSSKNSKTTTNDEADRTADRNSAHAGRNARDSGLGSESPSSKASQNLRSTNESAGESQARSTRRSRSAIVSKGEKRMATIGQSIVFKGELSGDEDLEIDGQVEGTVHLANNELTVGANGRVTAEVDAKSIVVVGRVKGNLTATERIEIQSTGVVEGDIRASRLLIQEGAVLNGSIDMTKATASAGQSAGNSGKTAPAAGGSGEARPSA